MAVETKKISKVLVANRGEIAVRVIRAARDAGIASVAVYAEPDAQAPFASLADEAFALGGTTSAESYLVFDKILDAAEKSGADAIHPGYGFLSENADFAQAVIDAGLTWIGPSPESIRDLGDKVTARHIAERAEAPMAPGTKDPVAGADEVQSFAMEYGLPVAIKAAFGGGGRGMKVAYSAEEIPELFESATREATSAFGRGECFVERYLDRARHVEAQVLADKHGNVVVVGTRDCSLQRRFQKLVEEAPAPFLSDEQRASIHESAKRICREADYCGAGTVEYLVGADGLISFLEVNTRLQVEHPVSEETTGLDLVREQFRIAQGEELSLREDPTPRGHAFEFRINGEDAAAGFMPAPGTIVKYSEPAGPGVRVDSGVVEGSVIGGQFDSMLAKLIVHGRDRADAIRRLIAERYPHHGVIGEEYGEDRPDAEFVWVIDPIDGTRAYLCGAPTWGVLIGLSDADGPRYGVIDQPWTGERFEGGLGTARMTSPHGERPLAVRRGVALAQATLMTTFPEVGTPGMPAEQPEAITPVTEEADEVAPAEDVDVMQDVEENVPDAPENGTDES